MGGSWVEEVKGSEGILAHLEDQRDFWNGKKRDLLQINFLVFTDFLGF